MSHRPVLVIASTLLASAVVGCADDDRASGELPPATASAASAMIAEADAARANPTGTLDRESVQGLVTAFDDWELCVGGGYLPGGLGVDVDDIDMACVDGDELEGTLDLACQTDGDATGSVDFAIERDLLSVRAHFVFDDVCTNGVCGDGEGAVEAGIDLTRGSISAKAAGDLTLYFQGEWRELKYGVTTDVGGLGISQDLLLWVDGESFVASTSVTSDGVDLSVDAGDDDWTCDLSVGAEAISGSCSGEAGGSISL